MGIMSSAANIPGPHACWAPNPEIPPMTLNNHPIRSDCHHPDFADEETFNQAKQIAYDHRVQQVAEAGLTSRCLNLVSRKADAPCGPGSMFQVSWWRLHP